MGWFSKNKYLLLFCLVFLFFLCRLCVMFSSEKIIWQGEEPFVGVVTRGIIKGWAMPPFDFQQAPHFGGAVFNSIVAVPFFMLLGHKIIALRLAAIFFHSGGLIALFFLISRYFSVRAAFFASCLYIFSPPLLTARSLIFNGGHAETAVFDILLLFVFLNLVFKNPSRKNYCLLGFLSGFSLWYAYSNLISIINYTFAWFIKDRKFFLNKKYLGYCVSFIAGFSPWFIYNLRNHFSGFDFIKGEFFHLRAWHPQVFLDAFADLIFKYAYKIFMFDQFSLFGGKQFNALYYLIFWISFLCLSFICLKNILLRLSCHKNKSKFSCPDNDMALLPVLTFPVIFFFMYAFSARFLYDTGNGIVDYRYDIIVLPFIFIILALFIDKLFSLGKTLPKIAGGLLFALLLFMGIAGNSRFIYSVDFRNSFLFSRAYDYRHIGRVAFIRYGADINKVKVMIAKIKDAHGIEEAYCGYGEHLSTNSLGVENLKEYIDLSNALDSESVKKSYFWGVGEGIIEAFYKSGINTSGSLREVFSKCEESDIKGVNRNYLYFGILARLSFMRGHEDKVFSINEITNLLDPKYDNLAYMYYGITRGAYICRTKFSGDYSNFFKEINYPSRKYCYIGMGAGIADFFSCDFNKVIKFIENSKAGERELLLEGAGLYFYKICDFDKVIFEARFPAGFDKYKPFFTKGIDVFSELVDPGSS